jgi:hypothetical protein
MIHRGFKIKLYAENSEPTHKEIIHSINNTMIGVCWHEDFDCHSSENSLMKKSSEPALWYEVGCDESDTFLCMTEMLCVDALEIKYFSKR